MKIRIQNLFHIALLSCLLLTCKLWRESNIAPSTVSTAPNAKQTADATKKDKNIPTSKPGVSTDIFQSNIHKSLSDSIILSSNTKDESILSSIPGVSTAILQNATSLKGSDTLSTIKDEVISFSEAEVSIAIDQNTTRRSSNESRILPTLGLRLSSEKHPNNSRKSSNVSEILSNQNNSGATSSSVSAGYWKFDPNNTYTAPYNYSNGVCLRTAIHPHDCRKTTTCEENLMQWVYYRNNGEVYPRFDVKGFRKKMKNKKINFFGSSIMRQQVTALLWTLGHTEVKWKKFMPYDQIIRGWNCKETIMEHCFLDTPSNITICWTSFHRPLSKTYKEGNYTIDPGVDSGTTKDLCVLDDKYIRVMAKNFDVVFVQSLVWWLSLHTKYSESKSKQWIQKITPTMYHDTMKAFLTKLSRRVRTIHVLGHTGVFCQGKTMPEAFDAANIPKKFGWDRAVELWDTALKRIDDELHVQVLDLRDPTMQSVHAHPRIEPPDCLHFCMNSAAVNIYIDAYWNEVFSQF